MSFAVPLTRVVSGRLITAIALVLGRATILAIALSAPASAQPVQRPRISPHESVSASVQGTKIEVVYGRPSMRGRKIFGGLVPYGRVWCPGADEATTLDSPRALQFGSITVPPGPHTIWILPTPERWTLIISREASGFHTQYNPQSDLGRVDLRKRELATPVERLTFAIEEAAGGGMLVMSWENTEVSVPFKIGR